MIDAPVAITRSMAVQGLGRQYAVAISATIITAAAGTTVGWTSPTLPFLLSENSTIPLTPDQSSWVASLMILTSSASPLPAAYMADHLGRKPTLLLAAIPYIIGWLSIMEATSVLTLYIGRMIQGIGYGIIYTTAPMYLGEIASNHVRGSMATLITVMSKVGILAQYCIGPYVSFTTLVGINMSLPVAFILTFICLPESPYYNLKQNNRKNAEKSLKFLRGRDNNNAELDSMEKMVNEEMKHESRWKDVFQTEGNRRALIIILGIYTTQQLCGSTAIISYAQQIFEASAGGLKAEHACIILGSMQLLTSTVSSLLVDRLGRKPLLLASSLGVGLSNLFVGVYFLLKYQHFKYLSSINLVPIVAIVIFICSYTIGLATVPFAITSEMFPTNIKSKATCIIQTYTALSTFAVTKLYQVVADNLGTYFAFLGFALFSALGFIFILFTLPETKGQSFETIQDQLNIKPKVINNKVVPEEQV